MVNDLGNAYDISKALRKKGLCDSALKMIAAASEKFDDQWLIHLGYGRILYQNGNTKKAIKEVNTAMNQGPEQYKSYIEGLLEKVRRPSLRSALNATKHRN